MVDLLHLASVETLTWKPPTPAGLAPSASPSAPIAKIYATDMVLQWAGLPAKPAPTKQSADYLVAMHELVRRIAQLKTRQSGEQLGAALLPQLQAEVEDVIRAQAAWRACSRLDPLPEPTSDSTQASLPLRQEWQVCAAQWLWWIAQSSHETLRLLEGCPAQVMTSAGEQAGCLRLVVGLTLQRMSSEQSNPAVGPSGPSGPDQQDQPTNLGSEVSQSPLPPEISFDLVTGEAVPLLLSASQRLQVAGSLIGQPTAAGQFLQQLTQQVLEAVPTLQPCFEGLSARWLMPFQPWQSGLLRLSLGLVFSPNSSTSAPAPDQIQAHPDQEAALETNLEASTPQLAFSQPAWLEQHVSIAVAQQLTQMFLQQPPSSDLPETVITHSCDLVEQLQSSLTLASRVFAQQTLSLNELAFRLQWGINRTVYEVMQLTSGLSVRLLCPQQSWQFGRLRLAVLLKVRTPEQRWTFDLVRRCVCPNSETGGSSIEQLIGSAFGSAFGSAPGSDRLAAAALAQTSEHDWCIRPVTLEQLETAFWQQIEQAAPEIALLRSDTEVMISTPQNPGQLGVLCLETAFEFWSESVRPNALSG
jgi:hypothetical protein